MEQVINEEEIKILISDYLSSFDPESRRKLSLIFRGRIEALLLENMLRDFWNLKKHGVLLSFPPNI